MFKEVGSGRGKKASGDSPESHRKRAHKNPGKPPGKIKKKKKREE